MNTIQNKLAPRFSFDPLELFLDRLWARPGGQETAARTVATVNLFESDTHYHAQVDLPGVSRENISVKCKENILEISTKQQGCEGETQLLRQLALPEEVRDTEITASHENGVLSLAIAKPAQTKTRSITIN